jgi:hypothetical protein
LSELRSPQAAGQKKADGFIHRLFPFSPTKNQTTEISLYEATLATMKHVKTNQGGAVHRLSGLFGLVRYRNALLSGYALFTPFRFVLPCPYMRRIVDASPRLPQL